MSSLQLSTGFEETGHFVLRYQIACNGMSLAELGWLYVLKAFINKIGIGILELYALA
jgi:hypothetical protein